MVREWLEHIEADTYCDDKDDGVKEEWKQKMNAKNVKKIGLNVSYDELGKGAQKVE